MKYAVAWLGPVGESQVGAARVPDAPTTFVTCTGDGSPDCSAIGAGIAVNGSIPAGLLRRTKSPEAELIIGSFSAGHEIAKPALMNKADRDMVRAVLLADSTYTSWQSPGVPTPPEGYVRYAVDAVNENKLFVATASHNPAGQYPSGYQTLQALKQAVEARTGRRFTRVDSLPGVSTPAEEVWRLGNVWLAAFGPSVSHGEHATKLAPQVWQGMLLPWLQGGYFASSGDLLAPASLLSVAFGAFLGWSVVQLIRKGKFST